MPLCYRIDNNDFTLGLWNLIETEAQLLQEFKWIAPENEIQNAAGFKNARRKSEWIAARLLLYELLDQVEEIFYHTNGKPFIPGHGMDISISHTKGLVAVLIAKKLAGIDVEILNDRVLQIEDRFLCQAEKECILEDHRIQSVLLIWSAKETLYKIFGEKGLDFKERIYIKPFVLGKEGHINGEIKSFDQVKSFNLNYFSYKPDHLSDEYIVVYHYA
jgi:4'-phosphopantetheinyl transferase